MTKQEWQELVRFAKNHGEYYKLSLCVSEHIRTYPERIGNSKFKISAFYKQYSQKTILNWYQTCYPSIYQHKLRKERKWIDYYTMY